MPTRVRLADLTTLRLGGPAPDLVTVRTPAEAVEAVMTGDRSGGVLVIGGGSNLVVSDDGIDVPVVRVAIGGVTIQDRSAGTTQARPTASSADGVLVTAGAGLNWDDLVAELVDDGFAELAPLSGIPGSTGATPVQNVGAYGTEVSDVLERVTVLDRATGETRTLTAAELALGYRTSVLRGTDRAVVLDVTFRLTRTSTVVRYAELAATLGVPVGAAAPPADVREAVLALRRGKGMVLDATDPDTFSAGSFFTNPLLDDDAAARTDAAIRRRLGADVRYPAYPAGERTKLSAAWLIERAGFRRGHRGPGGRVALSTKHTLALTNRGDGSTTDLLALAREVRDGVSDAFDVLLQPEPVLVGVTL